MDPLGRVSIAPVRSHYLKKEPLMLKMAQKYGLQSGVSVFKVDRTVDGSLSLNPSKTIMTPLKPSFKRGAHSSEPFKEAKSPY